MSTVDTQPPTPATSASENAPVTSVETAAGPTTGVGVPTAGSAEDVAPNVPGGAIVSTTRPESPHIDPQLLQLAAVVPGPSTPTLSREDLEEMLRNLQGKSTPAQCTNQFSRHSPSGIAQLGMIQQTPGQAVTPAAPVQSTVPNPTVTAAPANVSVPPTRSPAPCTAAAAGGTSTYACDKHGTRSTCWACRTCPNACWHPEARHDPSSQRNPGRGLQSARGNGIGEQPSVVRSDQGE